MNKKLIAASIAGILSTAAISTAQADLITFDGLAGSYMPGEDLFRHDSYVTTFINDAHTNVNGFNMISQGVRSNDSGTGIYNVMRIVDIQNWGSNSGLPGAVIDTFSAAWNGTDYATFLPQIGFNRVDGGSFSLNSIDMVMWSVGYGETVATITGNFAAGGTINQIIDLAGAETNDMKQDGDDFVHYNLVGFTDLASFSISQYSANQPLAIDNIDYTLPDPVSPVPESETYAMLLAGLGFIGFLARIKRS